MRTSITCHCSKFTRSASCTPSLLRCDSTKLSYVVIFDVVVIFSLTPSRALCSVAVTNAVSERSGLVTHLSGGRRAFHVEPPLLPGLHAPLGPVVADIRASVVPVGRPLRGAGRRLALGSDRFSQRGVGGLVGVEFTPGDTGFRPRSPVSLSHSELRRPVRCDVLVSIL